MDMDFLSLINSNYSSLNHNSPYMKQRKVSVLRLPVNLERKNIVG